MNFIRITTVLSVLAFIFVLPARSQDKQAEASKAKAIVQEILQKELNDAKKRVTRLEEALKKLTNSDAKDAVLPPAPQALPALGGPAPLTEEDAAKKADAAAPAEDATAADGAEPATDAAVKTPVASTELEQRILVHYQTNIAGTKSHAANPRKAVEAFQKAFQDALRRLEFVGDTIDAGQQEQMLEQLRGEIRSFFEDNQASATDWRAFLQGIEIDTKTIDPTKKSDWKAVLTELERAFGKVAALIQKEEAKNPFQLNAGTTAERARNQASDEGMDRYFGYGCRRHTQ